MPIPKTEIAGDKPHGQRPVFIEVLLAFLKLGVTSFGGPIAHVGYFRREFVEKRHWLNDDQFAQLLALCQFLPGPASSQLGFSLGLLRAGWAGALAAFLAFTLPSALLMFVFALVSPQLSGPVGNSVVHGLKLVALSIVAHGVVGMAKNLCPDIRRRVIAFAAAGLCLAAGGVWLQVAVIVMGAALGLLLLSDMDDLPEVALPVHYGRRTAWLLLTTFFVLLFGLPLLTLGNDSLFAVAEAFYRAGALVFGGGHVVLPFLEQAIVEPGWLSRGDFMTGYGAAQAVPGPMFSLSAYLGAHLPGDSGGLIGASIALLSIFLPGFLLVAGILPLWHTLSVHKAASRAIAGINASVVGLLAAALYSPIWVSAVGGISDVLIASTGFAMLTVWRVSALVVVLWCLFANVVYMAM